METLHQCLHMFQHVSWAEMPYTKSCNTSEKIGVYIPLDKQPEVSSKTQGLFSYSKDFNSTNLLVLS